MKKYFALATLLFVTLGLMAQGNMSKAVLKSTQDSASYSYGVMLASSIKRQMKNDLKEDIFLLALNEALRGDSLAIKSDDANKIFSEYNKAIQMKAGEANRMSGIKFLEENKKRKEVTTTNSGLQYEVLKKGDGTVKPLATDKVKVHYHGTLIDGTVFDSSVERGEPTSFGLNQVIKGWTEGLQYMHVGDKFRFYLPSEIAYGERSAGPKIKPYSALVFEVELLEINPK